MKDEFPDIIPVLITINVITVFIYALVYAGYMLAITDNTK